MSIKKKPQAWQVRKILYGLAAVVVGVLGWVGVLSDIKADAILDDVSQWLPIILGVLAPALAAAKTNSGSDSTVTAADVSQAARDAATTVATELSAVDIDTLARKAAEQVADLIESSFGLTSTPTAETAAAATPVSDYIYGR
jgi:hypothetical protein